jgi:hypothetical protein
MKVKKFCCVDSQPTCSCFSHGRLHVDVVTKVSLWLSSPVSLVLKLACGLLISIVLSKACHNNYRFLIKYGRGPMMDDYS